VDTAILIAALIGVAGGCLGAVPFFVVRPRMKKRMKTDGVGGIITGVFATMISFLIMAAQIVACFFINSDYLLPFAISAIAVFLLAMILFTATLMRK